MLSAGPARDSDDPVRFTLLARAVAGRPIAVTLSGDQLGHTDGEAVHVPRLPPALAEAAAVVQAALIGAGSLDPAVMARLAGHRRLRSRYLALEVARASQALATVVPGRVNELVARSLPGPVSASPQQSLEWAADRRRAIAEPPAWAGELKPITVLRTKPAAGGDTLTEDQAASGSWQAPLPEIHDGNAESSRIPDLFQAPVRGPLTALIATMLGLGRAPGQGGGGTGELAMGEHTSGAAGDNTRTVAGPPPRVDAFAPLVASGRRYPEWDHRRGSYRPGWCTVSEFDPPSADAAEPVSIADRALRRQLAGLGFSAEYHPRQVEGDVLDLSALVDFVADRAGGQTDDARIYAQRRRIGRDLGVLVLLDATGSSARGGAGRRQFDEHRVVVARLTAALEDLGDPVATFAFFSTGRDAVRFLRVKEFTDRFDRAAQRRLDGMGPGGFTRLGAALRHATYLLEHDAGTSRRLLVVVGDGFPYEEGYEGEHAEADSRRALDEAVARGIGCARISVSSGVPEDPAVARVWSHLPQLRLDRAGDLARQVRPLFARAIREAGASKRSIARGTTP